MGPGGRRRRGKRRRLGAGFGVRRWMCMLLMRHCRGGWVLRWRMERTLVFCGLRGRRSRGLTRGTFWEAFVLEERIEKCRREVLVC